VRRELGLALVLVLLGAALTYVSGSRDWIDALVPARPPLPPVERRLSGADVVGALRPLSFLALAAVAALAATRDRGRVAVGALVVLAGVGVVVATGLALQGGTFTALRDNPAPGVSDYSGAEPGFTAWWVLAVVGGLLLVAGGGIVATRGRRWAALSSRYDTPAARAEKPPPRPEVAAWDALDRGEDPTSESPVVPPKVDG
jgi:uncharacterized membrane protein (TIGR02234 family)